MSDPTFDPKGILESYRAAFAPALKAGAEGVKVLDRLSRYQYAVAGDYLEWSLTQAKAALSAQTPADFITKQVELTTALSEKLRVRAQEFVTLASESQATFTNAVKDSQASFANVVKDTATKAAEETKKRMS